VIWVEMLFLSAAKDYARVVLSFAVGYLISFLGAEGLGVLFRLHGLSLGFLVGQVVLMVLLMHRIFAEYRFAQGFDFAFLKHFRKYPSLALIGVCYNTAIWIDKILMWYAPGGLHIHSFFYTHFPYDSAMFIGYVTIVPTLAIFLLRIETDFYVRYKAYYGTILQKAPLDQILKCKGEMLDVLRSASRTVLIYQGSFTAGVLILMPYLVTLLGVDPAVGAFFHAGVLVLMILMLYFDFRGAALTLAAMFLLANTSLTLVALNLGPAYMGWGYTLATLLCLLTGLLMFLNRVRNLEYLTFMRQPMR
jgi:uncharacterized membrane protein